MEGKVRNQSLQSNMERSHRLIAAICLALVVALAGGIFIWRSFFSYQPPEREKAAEKGMPVPEESYLFSGVQSDFGYKFALAANLYQQEDGSLRIYFTNPGENDVYLKCEIVNEATGEVMYESGLLKPGSYVQTLKPSTQFANEATKVLVRIYAFEPKTYYSAGTTTLNTTLQAW